MVSNENERDFVADMYPGRGWKHKVNLMPDAQIHAIYIKEKEKEQNPEVMFYNKDKQEDIPF